MKVEVIKEDKEAKLTYPYLGESDTGLVVLFSRTNTGVVLKDAPCYEIGDYSGYWDEENFTPIKGKVILQND